MKTKKIAAICAKSKWVEIHDVTDGNRDTIQWVGNSAAMYRFDGVPYLAEAAVLTFLDIAQDKRKEYGKVHEQIDNDHGLHDDVNEKDTIVIPLGFIFDFPGGKVAAFQSEKGTVHLVNVRYLTPLSEDTELWERTIGEATYIIAKEGFLASAVIEPYEPQTDLLDKLERVTRGIKSQVKAQKANGKETEYGQRNLYEQLKDPMEFDEEEEEEGE